MNLLNNINLKTGNLIKKIILKIFYQNKYNKKVEELALGHILSIFFFQKILRYNSHVPFPVHFTSYFSGIEKLKVAEDVTFYFAASGGLYVQIMNGLEIGTGTIIAPGAKLISANHDMRDYNKHLESKPIIIGNNCWIGANAVILPEVKIGDNVVVAAGAVVSKSFDSYSLIGGVPAKLIKRIKQ